MYVVAVATSIVSGNAHEHEQIVTICDPSSIWQILDSLDIDGTPVNCTNMKICGRSVSLMNRIRAQVSGITHRPQARLCILRNGFGSCSNLRPVPSTEWRLQKAGRNARCCVRTGTAPKLRGENVGPVSLCCIYRVHRRGTHEPHAIRLYESDYRQWRDAIANSIHIEHIELSDASCVYWSWVPSEVVSNSSSTTAVR